MSILAEIILPLFAVLLVIFLSFYFSRRKEMRMEQQRGSTPFLQAILQGNRRKCEELLESGQGSVEQRNDEGETALMIAAGYGHADVAEWLLSKGADVNARSPEQATALMYAASAPSFVVVRILLNAGADPNASDDAGATPLQEAAYKEDAESVQLLLQAGAVPHTEELRELIKKLGEKK